MTTKLIGRILKYFFEDICRSYKRLVLPGNQNSDLKYSSRTRCHCATEAKQITYNFHSGNISSALIQFSLPPSETKGGRRFWRSGNRTTRFSLRLRHYCGSIYAKVQFKYCLHTIFRIAWNFDQVVLIMVSILYWKVSIAL